MSNFNGTLLNAGSGGPTLATSTFVNGSPAQNELMPWTAISYLASGNANDTTGVFQTVGPGTGFPTSASQSGAWSMTLLAGSALVGQVEISDGTNVLGTSTRPLIVSVNGNVTLAGTSAVSIADGANVTFGAEADAAALSDTATASYMALVKRQLQHLTTLIGELPAALSGAGNLKVALEESAVTVTVSVSGTTTVSGTVTANIGTTGGLALDATLTGGSAKAIARGGQKGSTNTNADITHTPSGLNHEALDVALYDASGNQIGTSTAPIRIDPVGTSTQPVSVNNTPAVTQSGAWTMTANAGTGTFIVGQATASNLNAQVQGPAASGAAKSGNPVQGGAVFNTVQPTVTSGQVVESQATARGAHIVATGVDVFHVTMDNASIAVTQSGAWTATANQGTAAALGSAWPVKVTDGTNTMPTGDSSARSIHTTIDNASIPATQSGTWNQTLLSGTAVVGGVVPSAATGSSPVGATPFTLVSAASNNLTTIKASAGVLWQCIGVNFNATSVRYLKFYDGSPTMGTTNAVYQIPLPTAGSANGAGAAIALPTALKFVNGIYIAVTGGMALNDNTAIGANEVVISGGYA